MPRVKRLQSTASYEAISGRRHTWIGSRSVAMLKSAVGLEITLDASKATIAVTNKAGHVLPGEALRVIILDVKIADANGKVIQHQQVFRSATSGEGNSDNRIPPDGTKQFTYALGSKETIKAKLYYLLQPTTSENEWITMAETGKTAP